MYCCNYKYYYCNKKKDKVTSSVKPFTKHSCSHQTNCQLSFNCFTPYKRILRERPHTQTDAQRCKIKDKDTNTHARANIP